jgi:hypothetical protein
MRRWIMGIGIVLVGLFLAIQLVPYGWQHSNPPVTADPPWPNARAAAIARTCCYDCHSNETNWPWYSYVAPMSWLVRKDVDEGRDKLNFSEWGRGDNELDDAIKVIREGEMPPKKYTLIHRDAKLTDEEATTLANALLEMGARDEDHRGPG